MLLNANLVFRIIKWIIIVVVLAVPSLSHAGNCNELDNKKYSSDQKLSNPKWSPQQLIHALKLPPPTNQLITQEPMSCIFFFYFGSGLIAISAMPNRIQTEVAKGTQIY